MKKFTLMAFAALAISVSSCKKDYVCECTYTYTDGSGDVTTDPMYNTTYRDIKRSDAKSRCQNSKTVDVSPSGNTSTESLDCKLK